MFGSRNSECRPPLDVGRWVTLDIVPGRDSFALTLTLDGPLVDDHRLPLSELRRISEQLHHSLRGVATVLARRGPSGTGGRSAKAIETSVDLLVVGGPRAGSFALAFELPRPGSAEQDVLLPDAEQALSERAVVALIDGLGSLDGDEEVLPQGFDRGVLRAISPFRTALKNGVTEIRLHASVESGTHEATIAHAQIKAVERLIAQPFRAEATAEGVLQMVDVGSLEFRIDRSGRRGISVTFGEDERDRVHDAVRQYVRVAGEGQFDPGSDEPSRIWASTVEVAYETLELDTGEFWRERGVDELAVEQDVEPFALSSGYDSDPWRDEDEARALIEAIHSS